ncbi:hypothetical protein [Trinickia mobilis]|uniref:hypothetical protein n=1 Tax=Trinickia mobilis TaxID=2816356 RepID=UPI001F5DAFB1|nr:hypothetical protein [Trinickia mobilis]
MHPFEARWFYGVYAAAVIGSAAFVARVPDLLSLNIAAQALNALLLPLVAGWRMALASGNALPAAERVRGANRVALIIGVSIACGIGIVGALGVLL